jgi:hypothetical protein
MTRSLFFAPAVIAAVAAAGLALCAAAGWNLHVRTVVAAGVVACLASTLALAPLILTRGATAGTVILAGLAGTVLHLMAFLILSLGAWAVDLIGQPNVYALWLLVFYTVSILPVARIIIQFIRTAPPESPGPQPRAP